MTDANLAGALNLPGAAREQGIVSPADLRLTAAARERHPAARWWWGERVIEGANGAYCYLCDTMIATWARAWPTTVEAIEAVLRHRAGEIGRHYFPPGTTAPVKSAGADAPPPEGQQ